MKVFRYVAIISVFILLGALLIHSLNSINQDIGRHLKSGQIIWETKSVYKTNLFSFTEPNTPFINHHWLSEVFFYLLNGLIGLKGLILLKVSLVLLAFILVARAVFQKTGIWPILISLIVGIFVFTHRTDIRPEIFSYLFLSFFLFAIFKSKYAKSHKWLYFLPLIQVFWTNMHIYFALGPMLLFLFLIDRLIHNKSYNDIGGRYIKKLAVIFTATSLATLINPNFIKGALLPFNILKNYGYTIVENQSIFFLKDYGILLGNIRFFEISLVILIIFCLAISEAANSLDSRQQ